MNKVAMIVLAAACLMLGGCKTAEKCEDDGCCEAKAGEQACCAAKVEAKAAALVPVNTVCPIGGHGAEKMLPVSYKGKVIGFCCQDCVESFNEMNEAEKDKVLEKAVAQGAAAASAPKKST